MYSFPYILFKVILSVSFLIKHFFFLLILFMLFFVFFYLFLVAQLETILKVKRLSLIFSLIGVILFEFSNFLILNQVFSLS